MSLRAWVGFIAISLVIVAWYAFFWPAWLPIREMAASSGVVNLSTILILDKIGDWVPLFVWFVALIHAFVSPPYVDAGNTWRG